MERYINGVVYSSSTNVEIIGQSNDGGVGALVPKGLLLCLRIFYAIPDSRRLDFTGTGRITRCNSVQRSTGRESTSAISDASTNLQTMEPTVVYINPGTESQTDKNDIHISKASHDTDSNPLTSTDWTTSTMIISVTSSNFTITQADNNESTVDNIQGQNHQRSRKTRQQMSYGWIKTSSRDVTARTSRQNPPIALTLFTRIILTNEVIRMFRNKRAKEKLYAVFIRLHRLFQPIVVLVKATGHFLIRNRKSQIAQPQEIFMALVIGRRIIT
ncbi:hypothetical protein CHS0354_035704 [Potamilus streckersoni]|uniref:Uncharacterized protein n=1 Tax=Potamilus streckersoni TaxID=2493646 RepID=A0AAE0WBE3_9BIVA|nr:hypothetical protein CHS0354_035704 [Potamilus streckersoni]